MKRNTYVRVIQLALTAEDVSEIGNPKRNPTTRKPTTVQTGWREGYLLEDIGRGHTIRLGRHIRDGKTICDCWCSSPICFIEGDRVITLRAQYRLLKVPPFDADRSLQAWTK